MRRFFSSLAVVVLSALPLSQAMAASGNTQVGNILQILIPATAYGATFYEDDEDGRMMFYKSFASTVVATHGLKALISKERPNHSDNNAFPSGHTSAAFQGASFLQMRYGWKVGLPAYVAATYVGWSRVNAKEHDWVDVGAGAALGILSNWYFTKPFHGFNIALNADAGSYGIRISRRF